MGKEIIDRIKLYTEKAIKHIGEMCCYCGEEGSDKVAIPDFIEHPERSYDSDVCHEKCELKGHWVKPVD